MMPDREKLIELLDGFNRDLSKYAGDPKFFVVDDNIELADHLISHGVTVRERGRWISDGELDEDGNGQYHCSVCSAGEKHNPRVDVPYCWKCGADMRGEDDG